VFAETFFELYIFIFNTIIMIFQCINIESKIHFCGLFFDLICSKQIIFGNILFQKKRRKKQPTHMNRMVIRFLNSIYLIVRVLSIIYVDYVCRLPLYLVYFWLSTKKHTIIRVDTRLAFAQCSLSSA
jgi:hypothetical protein